MEHTAIQKPTAISKRGSASTSELAAHILAKLSDLRNKRRSVETKWDMTYSMYRSNVEDMKSVSKASFTTGSTRQWKHRVNTGKTFEVVETLVAYFKGATFPSDDWFDVAGLEPNLGQVANIVKQLAKFKMEQATVRDVYDEWLRNLVIFGCATFQVGWDSCIEQVTTRTFDELGLVHDEVKNVEKETLRLKSVTPYDIWIDGSGCTFARLDIAKDHLSSLVEEGYYDLDMESIESYQQGGKDDPSVLKSGMGSPQATDIVEFYGPVMLKGARYQCVHAVFFGNTLIRLADSEYWCGSPYVTGTMLPDRDSVYGMTVLDPSAGALHTLNVLNNARLDNIAVSIDKMFTVVEDGTLRKEDIFTEPGKVFTVAQHGSIQPIDLGPPAFTLGYQEAQVQEGSVDRNCSTGPLIGGGQPRGGERVTAQEIIAVQESGGNRLASVHSHIEDSVTTKLLSKVFSMMQQYVLTPEMVRVFLPEADTYAFFQLEPAYLSYPFDFKPSGAAYVVEKQRQIGDLMTLFDISGRVPQLADKLDFERILLEVLKHMRFTNPSSYIKTAPPPLAPQAPQAQQQEPTLDAVGGAALQRTISEDGGASLLQGVGIDTSAMDPAQLQMMSQEALNYGAGTGTDSGTGLDTAPAEQQAPPPGGIPPF